jgi:hypothetical protein
MTRLACAIALSLFGTSAVFAEPLFFDCHGTVQHFGGKQEYWRQPTDLTMQIMVDPDKGVADAPGIMVGGTNEYCAQRSGWKWKQLPGTFLMRTIIRECTDLRTSETAFSFSTAGVSRPKQGETVLNPVRNWASGTLNRITGVFEGNQRVESHYEDSAIDLFERKMTCVPAER